jgi:hypothetical protein
MKPSVTLRLKRLDKNVLNIRATKNRHDQLKIGKTVARYWFPLLAAVISDE